MPASTHNSIGQDRDAAEPNTAAPEACTPTADVGRLAPLVADGEVDWPDDLPEQQAAELTAMVRRRRRSRLIKLIARLIAAQIA